MRLVGRPETKTGRSNAFTPSPRIPHVTTACNAAPTQNSRPIPNPRGHRSQALWAIKQAPRRHALARRRHHPHDPRTHLRELLR
eukprot:365483-Chlamydomonas_euryale.AAC.8